MRLVKVHIQNFRSIIDSGEFEIEKLKTILVGPNEAGKTVMLMALQQLNKPDSVPGFDALRDYPRSKYNEITTKQVAPKDITVITGWFELEDSDKLQVPDEFKNCLYKRYKMLNNKVYHTIENAPSQIYYKDVRNDMMRLVTHTDKNYTPSSTVAAGTIDPKTPSETLKKITTSWVDFTLLSSDNATKLTEWLDGIVPYVEEGNEKEEARHAMLLEKIAFNAKYDNVLKTLDSLVPVFVLFNNYYRVKPSIHLEHLANRTEQNLLDDKYYDYGNLCLLKLLGFSPRELSDVGKIQSPNQNDTEGLKEYKDQLDKRSYQLNAASVKLTNEIKSIWSPDPNRPEANKLKISADGQYLKVVVEDDLGVEIELDQRSEGFQWIVSFFVVFFAEAMDKHKNAVLLLDEPGMSLHGLKQRDFRGTISRLAEKNQTIYTTHSPFLVGPDELDIVRVVEMKDRKTGTKIVKTITSSDPAGLLPLQEALGYDLAQSLFAQQKNLVLEGLTDYWYIEATSQLLKSDKIGGIDDKIAMIFANTASKVVYFATILHAHNLKVAALLDSDNAGEQAAKQEALVNILGNKNILRTKDYCTGIEKAEIEDLLRDTLVLVINTAFSVDVSVDVTANQGKPFIDIISHKIPDFSKYKLAKAYIRWTHDHSSSDLTTIEKTQWKSLFDAINKVLE
jgi:predicted ATP-dependent endonuclease of OLD family